MAAAVVALAIALVGAAGTAVVLALRLAAARGDAARIELAVGHEQAARQNAELTRDLAHEDAARLERVVAEKDRLIKELRDEIPHILQTCGDASAGAAAVGTFLDGVLAVPTAGRAVGGGAPLPAAGAPAAAARRADS